MKLIGTQILGGARLFQQSLRGVAIGPEDQIALVGDQQVQLYDPRGKLLHRWPTTLAGRSLTFDSQGNLLVGQTGQVERFDRAGRSTLLLRDVPRLGRVTALAQCAEFPNQPECLLLADATHRCIRTYDADSKWLGDLGADNNTHGFLIPNGRLEFCVVPSRDGIEPATLFATNPAKHRLEQYTFDGKQLGHFGRFGHRPEDFFGCCNPIGLAFAFPDDLALPNELPPRGDLVIAEKGPPRVKVYDTQGKLLAAADCRLIDPNCKHLDLAVDSLGRILVTDTKQMSLIRFESDPQARQRESSAANRSANNGKVPA